MRVPVRWRVRRRSSKSVRSRSASALPENAVTGLSMKTGRPNSNAHKANALCAFGSAQMSTASACASSATAPSRRLSSLTSGGTAPCVGQEDKPPGPLDPVGETGSDARFCTLEVYREHQIQLFGVLLQNAQVAIEEMGAAAYDDQLAHVLHLLLTRALISHVNRCAWLPQAGGFL